MSDSPSSKTRPVSDSPFEQGLRTALVSMPSRYYSGLTKSRRAYVTTCERQRDVCIRIGFVAGPYRSFETLLPSTCRSQSEREGTAYLSAIYGWNLLDSNARPWSHQYEISFTIPLLSEAVDAGLIVNRALFPDRKIGTAELRGEIEVRIMAELAHFKAQPLRCPERDVTDEPQAFPPICMGSDSIIGSVMEWEVRYWLIEYDSGEWALRIEGEDGSTELSDRMSAEDMETYVEERGLDVQSFHERLWNASQYAWRRFRAHRSDGEFG